MRMLVLGGTHFVGRALVEAATAADHEVTTVTRGVSGRPPVGVRALHADRTDHGQLAAVLGDETFDAVLDTWSFAPYVVRESARLLADRAEHYGYVSSRSAYRWPLPVGADESAPVVHAEASSEDALDYAAAKRGAELAVLESFEDRALLARAGLVLGPHEDVGRLPWWLARVARGGRVLAPGPRERPLQYVDARDLAGWMVHAAEKGLTGAFNTVSRPGHTTIGELLNTCVEVTGADAELVWTSPDVLAAHGITGWTDLPIWVPPDGELAGLHAADVTAATSRGLDCRPVRDTVRDTWRWLRAVGDAPVRRERSPVGLSPEREREVLGAAR